MEIETISLRICYHSVASAIFPLPSDDASMIHDHFYFKYQDLVLIEKMRINPPFKYEADFQNRGCFIYYKNRGPLLMSVGEKAQIHGQEAVLLKCGTHFLELINETESEEVEAIVIHLYPELLKKLYIKELPELLGKRGNRNPSQIVASNDVISKFIESLEFYFQNPLLVNDDLLELKIKELILLLLQSKNIDSIQELVTDLYSGKAVQLKEVVDLHLYSNLNLEELAKLSNLSLTSFKREFKKEFNDSPNQYFNRKKIEKAKELLSITKLSVAEIAYEVGFNDPYYFTRLFKQKSGCSPSHFRMEQHN